MKPLLTVIILISALFAGASGALAGDPIPGVDCGPDEDCSGAARAVLSGKKEKADSCQKKARNPQTGKETYTKLLLLSGPKGTIKKPLVLESQDSIDCFPTRY